MTPKIKILVICMVTAAKQNTERNKYAFLLYIIPVLCAILMYYYNLSFILHDLVGILLLNIAIPIFILSNIIMYHDGET